MSETVRRLKVCVDNWPGCYEGGYDPFCCRFPKSCSCDVYDPERVKDEDLEELTMSGPHGESPVEEQGTWADQFAEQVSDLAWSGKPSAKIEISLRIDEATYAEFYGEDVSGETLQDAYAELYTLIRHAFQVRSGQMHLPWFEARVGRVVPVPEVVSDDEVF